MSDLVGNPEDRFSQNEAHFSIMFAAITLEIQAGLSLDKCPNNTDGMTNSEDPDQTAPDWRWQAGMKIIRLLL